MSIYGREEKRIRETMDRDNAARAGSRADRNRRVSPRGSIDADQFPLTGDGKRRHLPPSVMLHGEEVRDGSIGAGKLAFNPALAGHGHNSWTELPGGMKWGTVDQQSFFSVLDKRYRRIR